MNGNVQPGLDEVKLRHRNVPTQAISVDEARTAVLELNAQEEKDSKDEKDRKTFGRTPDGTGRTSRENGEPRSAMVRPAHPMACSRDVARLVV